MNFTDLITRLTNKLINGKFIKATISQPQKKSNEIKRIRLKPIQLREELFVQFEYQSERIITHENIPFNILAEKLTETLQEFRQLHAEFTDEKVHIQLSKKLKVMWKTEKVKSAKVVDLAHNRQKQYILDANKAYPFLIRLGVQSANGKVKNQYQDKFRQINRFLEFIDDSLKYLPQDRPIRILDFGSGKSYLTFALYHYLHIEKGLAVNVTGLDLKKEVIEECAAIAKDLNYENLEFLVGDINDYHAETEVDMVVTLHACDTATDMALGRAVKWDAKVILSVPCCQHELFSQVDAADLNIILQHGLMKERFSALATDSIRAELLTFVGYETQLLEFIDMEHTAKNVLIRAYKTGKKAAPEKIAAYQAFKGLLNVEPFLEKELGELIPELN